MYDSPSLHEFLAHTHLLTERQRRQGSIGPVGPLFCVHAEGIRDGQSVAVDRFFAADSSPAAALLALRNYSPERDNLLFVVDAPLERRQAFVRAGFRLVESQWLMGCNLAEWQPVMAERAEDVMVRPATDARDALLLSAIDGLEPIPMEELRDPALTHYYCLAEDQPTAYGRSARYDEAIAWVSHVYTAPAFRKRGHAWALMSRLLLTNRQAGVDQSLLLATEMAHVLYRRIGYTDLAEVAILQLPPALLRRGQRRR
ncbi:MAG: hypothetical protein KJZ86_08915 [Caldilineaceae bacterium]|nr:hypothetical protein [Caldilineaceae bacterium]